MKIFSFECGAVVLALIVCYFIHKQNEKITKLQETIQFQDEAIQKQRVLIYLQQYKIENPGQNIFNRYQ